METQGQKGNINSKRERKRHGGEVNETYIESTQSRFSVYVVGRTPFNFYNYYAKLRLVLLQF